MAHAGSPSISFVDALLPARGTSRTMRATLSAKLQVPFYPVPMTMQTLVVLLIGLAFALPLGGAATVRWRLGV